jgi:D-methionine transport system substrate-binding protein
MEIYLMNFKKVFGFAAVAALSVAALAACAPSSGGNSKEDKNTLKVGIMTQTDATEQLWDKVSENAKKEGLTLEFVEFTDYSQPNKALANGEIDVNAFQHYNFLNNWNTENKGDLVAAADTLISPLRIFSGLDGDKAKYTDISELPDGAVISVPNDATNESRALYLLQTAGLIKLDVSGEELATKVNISENPKKLDIKELDASQTASTRTSVDAAIINNNYAVDAGVDYATVLFKEEINAESKQWVNVIAAQKDWEKSDKADAIKILIKSYQTDEVAKILSDSSNGVDVPAWEGAPSTN